MKRRRRLFSIMMILCLLISCSSLSAFASSGNYVKVSVTVDYSEAREVLRLINVQRTKRGLSKLKLDKSLCDSAVRRAAELTIYVPETSPHKRPNGKSNRTINKKLIYECCAEEYESPKSVMKGWMSSPPHKKGILLSNAKSVGIGCVTSKNGTKYWTLEFGSSAAQKKVSSKGKISKTLKISAKSTYLKKKHFRLGVGGNLLRMYLQDTSLKRLYTTIRWSHLPSSGRNTLYSTFTLTYDDKDRVLTSEEVFADYSEAPDENDYGERLTFEYGAYSDDPTLYTESVLDAPDHIDITTTEERRYDEKGRIVYFKRTNTKYDNVVTETVTEYEDYQ